MTPVATVLRVVPDTAAATSTSGSTAHLLTDGRPSCGRRPRGLQPVDVDNPPPVQVCASCLGTLSDLTRMQLATLNQATTTEKVAVHDARIRTLAAQCAAAIEYERQEAIFDGTVSERVHLIQAAPNERGPEHKALDITFGGHTAVAVPMTLGLLAGTLKPGAMTGGRTWITDAPEPGTPVDVPAGSASSALAAMPHAPGRPTGLYLWPYRQGGGQP